MFPLCSTMMIISSYNINIYILYIYNVGLLHHWLLAWSIGYETSFFFSRLVKLGYLHAYHTTVGHVANSASELKMDMKTSKDGNVL